MLLGDLIARLDDDTVAAETLLALGDIKLIAWARTTAARDGVSVGSFLIEVIGRLAQAADPDAWLSLMSAAGRSDNPGAACLRTAIVFTMRARSSEP